MEKLQEAAKKVEDMRHDFLFDMDLDAGLDELAVCEYLQALAFMELAHRALSKAAMLQSRALAASPYRQ